MKYQIIHFEQGNYKEYRKFISNYNEFQQENPTDLRRKWWCLENPSGGIIALAHNDRQIVATCYLSGKRIHLKTDTEINAYEIGETWTHHEHRRRGLFAMLVKYCEEYAFNHDAKLIYGTPNSQSTPGYFKLNYTIINPVSSLLLFRANLFWFIRRNRKAVGCAGDLSVIKSCYKKTQYEISSVAYKSLTINYPRLSSSSPNGVDWRLEASAYPYRFFEVKKDNLEFQCAIRYGILGSYPILVVSEIFLNGLGCDAQVATNFLGIIARKAYSIDSYAGIYFHSNTAISLNKLMLIFSATIYHRQLPFCIKAINEVFNQDFSDAITRFQLSDCDIG